MMLESPAVLHINGRAPEFLNGPLPEPKKGKAIAAVPESRADTRWLSYDELMEMTGMSRDSIVRIARRNKWPKREGNVPGEMRFAVPTSMVVDLQTRRPGSPGASEPKEGVPGAPTVLGAIYQKFMLLEEREERLEGYLREQMEREYARANTAEAALTKAERRLEKYNQGLEAMQVAVAARATAEAALVAATHRIELMQAVAETERAQLAEAGRAGDARCEALKQEAGLAEEHARAMVLERDEAYAALEAASARHAQLMAEAAAEQGRLTAVVAEERIRSGAFLEQFQLATAALHDHEERRIAAEAALATVNEQLERTQTAAQAERAHIELILNERLSAAEAAAAASTEQLAALQGVVQAREAELAGAVAAHAGELQTQQAKAQEAIDARLQTEAAMTALDARLIQTQNAAMAERAHLEATYGAQVSDMESQLQQVRLEMDRVQAENAGQQGELHAALSGKAAELASWQEQAKQAAEAAGAASAIRDQALAALAALTNQMQAAEAVASHERGGLAAVVAEARADADRMAVVLREAEARGDRAMAQLEAERVRTKQAAERAAEAEAKLQRQQSVSSAPGLVTRLLGLLRGGQHQPVVASGQG